MSQDKTNALMRKLDKLGSDLSNVRKDQQSISTFVRGLRPETYLHPIPRPKYEKIKNVARLMHDGIEAANIEKGEGQLKHVQFPEGVADKQLNSDAMRCLEHIMHRHISERVGVCNYEKTYEEIPAKCAVLLLEAEHHLELRVFAQSAGQWAIVMLISERMKALKGTATARATSTQAENGHTLAPMVVPDLVLNAGTNAQVESGLHDNDEAQPDVVQSLLEGSGVNSFSNNDPQHFGHRGSENGGDLRNCTNEPSQNAATQQNTFTRAPLHRVPRSGFRGIGKKKLQRKGQEDDRIKYG